MESKTATKQLTRKARTKDNNVGNTQSTTQAIRKATAKAVTYVSNQNIPLKANAKVVVKTKEGDNNGNITGISRANDIVDYTNNAYGNTKRTYIQGSSIGTYDSDGREQLKQLGGGLLSVCSPLAETFAAFAVAYVLH